MLSENKITANYLNFIKYLEKYECYSEQMFIELGEKINSIFSDISNYKRSLNPIKQ